MNLPSSQNEAGRAQLRAAAAAALCGLLAAAAVMMGQQPENNPPKLEKNYAAAVGTPPPNLSQSKTQINFVGATKFNPAQLRAAIADQILEIDKQGLTPADADDAAFFLGNFYRSQGYSSVTVDFKIQGTHTLQLNIAEGPLVVLTDVNFQGAVGLPPATLKDYVTSTTKERFPNPKTALPFVQADVDTGVDRIRGLYASEGFLNAVVDPPKITFNREKTEASVLVTVHEGMKFTFGKIMVQGDLVYFPNTDLLGQLKPFTEKPYTPGQVTNIERAVVYYYKTRGYYDPKVDVQSDVQMADKNGRVPVSLTVATGPLYRFGGVSQEGLGRLNPHFLPNRFAKLKGKFYSPQALDDEFRAMMQTGLFRQLRVEPRPLPNDTLELHLKVEEEKAKELGFSLGYGTFEGPIIGLIAGDRDLFGTGRPLTANLELSANFLRGEVLYSDPWLLESDFALQARLFGQSEQFYKYSVLETGFRPEISRQLTKQLQASLFFQAKEGKATSGGITPEDLGPSSYFVSSLGATATFDTRGPDKVNPRTGMIFNLASEVAASELGSSVEFLRTTARFSYYIPVTSKSMLALGVRAGWMKPLAGNAEDIPINERFFNGGARSVRSFPERRLAPMDRHGFPIGGDTFTTFNAEYQFPVWGQLLGAIFFDAGSVGRTDDSGGQMRYAVGPGIRYASPVGPLRIDYGINPTRRPGERRAVLHISFGVAF